MDKKEHGEELKDPLCSHFSFRVGNANANGKGKSTQQSQQPRCMALHENVEMEHNAAISTWGHDGWYMV